jgi:ADP-heptose:LPS heptosyltransferase
MKMLEFLDIHTDNISKEVYKSPNADRKVLGLLNSKLKTQNPKLIGIAVSSGNKLKELGVKITVSLVNELINDLNLSIVLIGSEADKNTAQEILNMSIKKDAVIDSTGVFSLSELPALIERLSLFIGVDTGITYMADALSVPLIDIAGPSDMSDQRPLGEKTIIIQKDISCVPCSHAFNAPYSCKRGDRVCITMVSASEITEAVRRLL